MMKEKLLSTNDMMKLREIGNLNDNEIAYLSNNDMLIAENVVTKERRVIEDAGLLLESRRGLLKG